MSDAAKNRVISLGAQFNTFEKAAAAVPEPENAPAKRSFWRKNVEKVPGRPVSGTQAPSVVGTSTSTVGAGAGLKAKAKKTLSFQEFNKKTCDAWEESDDDMMKVEVIRANPPLTRSQSCDAPEVKSHEESAGTKQEEKKEDVLPSKPKISSSQRGGLSSLMLQRPVIPIKSFKLDLQDQELIKLEKFGKLLAGPNTNLDDLRELSWSGIPAAVRPTTWQLLCGYLPANIDRRQNTLDRKRDEYHGFVRQYYHTRHEDIHKDMFRQIHIDIPRTNPLIPLFQHPTVQEIFERILYIWAVRHPASGYVQGINDLVTPFFVVFLSAYVDDDIEHFDVDKLPRDILDTIEADSFWCMSKLLDGIQDNYTFAQPGIQTKVNALRELVRRINERLHKHLEVHNVEYLQFAFRWMNNLLMREMPLHCTIRLWDTYLSEQNGFATFHLYVCASFLDRFSDQMLAQNDFQNLLIFLQNLPTEDWGDADIGLLLAEAYRWKYMFADAPKHLQASR